MALLENQTVLLIAPQPWNHIHLSKHHYAVELARRGNTVYYLDPPDVTVSRGVRIDPVEHHPGIRVVRYRPAFPFVLRFHARPFFDLLMRRQIHAILSAIGQPIDVVWSFEFNLFSDLRAFGAKFVIFHPVDPLSHRRQIDVARSADVVFSVSEEILASFRETGVPAWFINHGLSDPFAAIARNPPQSEHDSDGVVRVGYAGNLTRPPLNRAVLRRMILENAAVEFHFWGPSEVAGDIRGDMLTETAEFIQFLRDTPTVRLHGSVAPAELALQMQAMDCFVLAYSLHPDESDRSNSHKILEYLSTGKVVVSSRISTYAHQKDLLRMPGDGDDSGLPALLRETLDRLEEFNAPALQEERRRFALDHTYPRQLERIKETISCRLREASGPRSPGRA
jgi:glycosyltransferase involved in cell wall biosynthesis